MIMWENIVDISEKISHISDVGDTICERCCGSVESIRLFMLIFPYKIEPVRLFWFLKEFMNELYIIIFNFIS